MGRVFYVVALFVASLNLRPAITSVAPLVETLQDRVGMSGVTASLLTTLPVLCMGIFAPLASRVSGRFGLERAIFYSLLLITVATFVRGVAGSVVLLVVTAFLAGVGIGIAGPLMSGFIKKYFPTRPGMVSVYTVAMAIGAGGAAGLAVPVFHWSGDRLGVALACWGLFGVLALVVWVRFGRGSDEGVVPERAGLPVRSGRAWLLTVFFALMSSIFYTSTAWVAPVVQSMGYGAVTAGTMLTVFTLVQIPVSLVLPGLVARYGRLFLALVVCSVLELCGVLVFVFDGAPLLAVLCLGLGAGGLFPLALMLPIVETGSPEEAGAWSAMSQGGGYVFAALGPLAVGALYDVTGGFEEALVMMGVIIAAMIVVQIVLAFGKSVHQQNEVN